MRKFAGMRMILSFTFLLSIVVASAQSISFTVSMDNPADHNFRVLMQCSGLKGKTQDFKMPVWTPGYYQRLDFAKNLDSFSVTDGKGKSLAWEKVKDNSWRVQTNNAAVIKIAYIIKTTRAFV